MKTNEATTAAKGSSNPQPTPLPHWMVRADREWAMDTFRPHAELRRLGFLARR